MSSEVVSSVVYPAALRSVLRAGLVAAALAVIGNVLILVVSQSILGITFVVPPPPGSTEPFRVSAINVILDTVIMAVGATLVFALVARMSLHPIRLFLIISVFILLLSFMFPLLLQVDTPMKLTLCVMHILAAVIIVGAFIRLGR